jgi:hypothetical protein
MKARTNLTRICIAIVFLNLLNSGITAQAQWLRFISPDNEFSISFPGKPNHETHTNPTWETPLELYTITFNAHLLNIGIKKLKPAPKTQRQRASTLFGAVRSQLDWIEKVGGRLLKQQPLPDGGVQFDYIGRLDNGTQTYNRDRIYIYGIRYYQLRCLSTNPQGLDESIANKFFNSFRFITTKVPTNQSSGNTKPRVNGKFRPSTHESQP